MALAVTAAAAAGYVYRTQIGAWTSARLARDADASKGEDSHAGHDHAPAAAADSLELTPQARKNLGLDKPGGMIRIALGPYERTITVPGMIVERPGRSKIALTAPLTGIVTRVHPIEGEFLAAGAPLFEIRMTHEELVQAQSDFLKTTEELDVVGQEVTRLEKLVAENAVAKMSLRERKFEQQKLQAMQRAQRQALLLHGLSEAQVDDIAETHTLVRGMSVSVPEPEPPAAGTEAPSLEAGPQLFQVQDLAVEQGQHVDAGDTLCALTDHAVLYIEGKTFERDAEELNKAVEQIRKVTAIVETNRGQPLMAAGLGIVYVANQVDPETRTLEFYVRLPNEVIHDATGEDGHRFISWRFKPGQRVQLRVPVETWKDRIVLPATAVIQDGAESYVFQENGRKFNRRAVHVEHRDADWIVIANDGSLFPGDRVAAISAQRMQLAIKSKTGAPIDPHAGHNH